MDNKEIIQKIIDYLNEKTNKIFRAKTKATIGFINARLKDKYTLEDFYLVIDTKVEDWKNDRVMNKYLRPSTLFNPTNFENYLNEGLEKRKIEKEVEEIRKEFKKEGWEEW
ncbi:conserved phage C-terminal domain-containing protein [Streptobacillus moniliformis]|uniref:conserved phage C-terminal domain-containing protein n=1 Tax=Streptobacillus moniliformis TaxID=34105 RepID=UPI0007E450E0|nr:conserved phage C-terminal domain-containing protein [Streptobacillus moniliformis]